MKRYKLTKNSREVYGRTVCQIQATADFGSVKKGDLGGWIEREKNLLKYLHQGTYYATIQEVYRVALQRLR